MSAIPEAGKEQRTTVAVRILAHMRDHAQLTPDNLLTISRGTRLRKADLDEVLNVMRKLKLLRKIKNANAFKQGRKIFS